MCQWSPIFEYWNLGRESNEKNNRRRLRTSVIVISMTLIARLLFPRNHRHQFFTICYRYRTSYFRIQYASTGSDKVWRGLPWYTAWISLLENWKTTKRRMETRCSFLFAATRPLNTNVPSSYVLLPTTTDPTMAADDQTSDDFPSMFRRHLEPSILSPDFDNSTANIGSEIYAQRVLISISNW